MSGNRVRQSIPSLINGVSQQAMSFRLGSQCSEQLNGLSNVLDGLSKRPPSELIRIVGAAQYPDTFVHTINRDEQERYLVLVSNGEMRIFDLYNNGNSVPVYMDQSGIDYLQTFTPSSDIKMTTVADYTFVLNTTKTITVDPTEAPASRNHEAIVYVKKGVVETRYSVAINGSWYSYTTGKPGSTVTQTSNQTTSQTEDGTSGSSQTTTTSDTVNYGSTPSTETIASNLAQAIRASGAGVEVLGSVMRIRIPSGADFDFNVNDSWGNEALMGFKENTQKFTDLPARCFEGTKVRVVGEDPTEDDDYYLEYHELDGNQIGVWEETVGWNTNNSFDASTMPHTLVREADGSFSFGVEFWDKRTAGDDFSNPFPTFLDHTISDIFFYRDRLGFISDENVILSGATEFFDFFSESAINVLESDMLDVAVTNDTVSILRHALVFGDVLVLFSDQTQFQLSSGSASYLGPTTVQVDKTTEYLCSKYCKPVGSGNSLFFVTEREDYSGIREYKVSSDYIEPNAPEITSHVPEYIPNRVTKMTVAINDGTLFCISNAERNSIWVYRYYWIGDQKSQSCWSKWSFSPNSQILNIGVIGSILYVLINYQSGLSLEQIRLHNRGEERDLGYRVALDRKTTVYGSYNSQTDTTSWSLPYGASNEPIGLVIAADMASYPRGFEVEKVQVNPYFPTTATAPGNYGGAPCICGFKYPFVYEFSEQFIREADDASAPVFMVGVLKLLDMHLLYTDSGYFRSEVVPRGRNPIIKEHFGITGNTSFKLDTPSIDSGRFKFSVLSDSRTTRVRLLNDSIFPCSFQAAEWTGTFNNDERSV